MELNHSTIVIREAPAHLNFIQTVLRAGFLTPTAVTSISPVRDDQARMIDLIPHFGQLPGFSWMISGCIGQVYSWESSALAGRIGNNSGAFCSSRAVHVPKHFGAASGEEAPKQHS